MILVAYTILFAFLVTFFEMRLDHIHKRHIEKLWPV